AVRPRGAGPEGARGARRVALCRWPAAGPAVHRTEDALDPPRRTAMSQARRFRELLQSGAVVRSLGAHDVVTARLVEAARLAAVFLGGFGTAAALLGLPDVGFITLSEMADAVRRMALRVNIPVVADGDTGHGDLHNVVRTVREFERAGAAAVILEDQVTPKRCGHFEGKQVIPTHTMVLNLPASLNARRD